MTRQLVKTETLMRNGGNVRQLSGNHRELNRER